MRPAMQVRLFSQAGSYIKLPGVVLLEKLPGGGRPPSKNPYPICGQNLRFFLTDFCPNQKFDILFMTVAADTAVLKINFEEVS